MPTLLRLLRLAAACVAVAALQAADLDDADLDARIDRLRRGDLAATIVDAAGKPIAGPVSYRLVRHEFQFGTAIANGMVGAEAPTDDQRRYQEILARHFNAAVAENAMKWYHMERERGVANDEEALRILRFCESNGLELRGHCLFWGIDKYVQPWVKKLEPAELEAAMRARAKYALTLFRGKVAEWDCNNEMIHGDFYRKKLGLADGSAYFRWAREADPDVRLYVNDYNILSGGEIGKYVAHIKGLIDAGAPVGGIGDQGHFGGRVADNAKLWRILDQLGQFNLPVKITEFDIRSKDEAQQAADTRRFYRLCFAHPAVHGVLAWGFWEGKHWIPEAAMWRKDWSIKPNGEAYVRLMEQDFMSAGEASADAQGVVRFRGFFGDYELSAGGRTWRARLLRASPAAPAAAKP